MNTSPLKNSITNQTALEQVVWPESQDFNSNNIVAFQTTRIAPTDVSSCSSSPYNAFNLGLHVKDNPFIVEKNRDALLSFLPSFSSIQWLNQVHGNEVAEVSKVNKSPITADAVITREKKLALAVMTADCLPILLSDEQGEVIAAIHGGWRPLAVDIIKRTLQKMQTPSNKVFAWLGPCIGPNHFEVGEEVKNIFCQNNAKFETAFNLIKHKPPIKAQNKPARKYLADLQKVATIQLNALGVKHIHALQECSYELNDKYYSYRKSSVTGRMASIICIK